MKSLTIPEETILMTPDEKLQGVVCFSLEEETEVKEIEIKLTGKCEIEWTENDGDDEETHNGHHEIIRDFLHPITKDARRTLQAGAHEFPFIFPFPVKSQNLPTTYKFKYHRMKAKITYKLKVALYKTGKFLPSIFELPLNIYNPPVLESTELQVGVTEEDDKTVCCLCCASGPITLKMSIPKTGYIIGEDVYFDAYATNCSERQVELKMKLYKQIQFTSNGNNHKEKLFEIQTVEGPTLPPNTQHAVRFTGSIRLNPESTEYGVNLPNLLIAQVIEAEASISGTLLDIYIPIKLSVGVLPPPPDGGDGIPAYFLGPMPGAYEEAMIRAAKDENAPQAAPPSYDAATSQQIGFEMS